MLSALLRDGHQARGRPVQVDIEGDELVAHGADTGEVWRWPRHQVQWPERTRHGRRVAHLPGGGTLAFDDAPAFDDWQRAHGAHEGWIVRAQQHWGAVAGALAALVLVVVVGWQWGIPWTARLAMALIPPRVDAAVGEAAYQSLAQRWLQPSQLPPERQQQLRAAFAAALDRAHPSNGRTAWTLSFAAAGKELGANAFALPGGRIVVTDAMVELLAGRDDTLIGVLGHEFGHVHHRHGMRGIVQAMLVGALASVAVGDFSTLLAGAPALLAQMAYSRDFEREADAESVQVLRAAGLSPAAMTVLFERLAERRGRDGDDGEGLLRIALASHPVDAERLRFFREAAGQR